MEESGRQRWAKQIWKHRCNPSTNEDHPPELVLSEVEWIVADRIIDYLHGKLSQAQLVDWAEHAMMDADFDETDIDLLTDIVGRLGLADVGEFGLRWRASGREPDSTEGGTERQRVCLGNPGNRDSRELISTCEEFLRRLGYRAKVIVSSE